MTATKADIVAQLQKDILSLQGFKPSMNSAVLDKNLGPIKYAFPNASFPLGAIHEFCARGPEDTAASNGFVAALLSSLMQNGGAGIWIGSSRTLFPPALRAYGIEPDKIIFIDLKKEKDVLWAMEEALKCDGLAAVIGEIPEISFAASRRLQLTVEQSRVTGFIVRHHPRHLNTTACVTRWRVTHLPSESEDNLPGISYPRWNVELLRVRNGKPGTWKIEWVNDKLRPVYDPVSITEKLQKKTG
jgi:protein ImuA